MNLSNPISGLIATSQEDLADPFAIFELQNPSPDIPFHKVPRSSDFEAIKL